MKGPGHVEALSAMPRGVHTAPIERTTADKGRRGLRNAIVTQVLEGVGPDGRGVIPERGIQAASANLQFPAMIWKYEAG